MRATYMLTIIGPDDFDFDLEDAADAIHRHLRDNEPEGVISVRLQRIADPETGLDR